ncbi:MAG: class I SAM-dependent methyltransferase [Candidatus Omnitrophota bacterium]
MTQKQTTKNSWNQFWSSEESKTSENASWSKRRIIKVVEPFAQKGKNALDAGCGSGFFAKYFCDQGMNTTACDYSEQALKMTSEKTDGRAKTIQCDLTKDELASCLPERFSLIFSDGLLEHFDQSHQIRILRNLAGLLGDDGILATFVPNRWSPWQLLRPFLMPGIYETPFTTRTLISVHEINELDVIQKGGINTIPFAISPDRICGQSFGMLLYVIAKKKKIIND